MTTEGVVVDDKARRYCNAKKHDGGTCRNTAGFRTPHPNYGRCFLHGGTAPNVMLAAAKEQLEEIASLSTDIDVAPEDVLLSSIGRSWGAVNFCAARISQIEESARELNAEQDLSESERARKEAALSKLLITFSKLYGEWIDRAAGLSKLALDLGLEERRVRLAEKLEDRQLDLAEALIRAILDSPEVGMTPEQRKTADLVLYKALDAGEAKAG